MERLFYFYGKGVDVMGRQRDPNRNKAFEIYKASNGDMSLIDIAMQLGVSDGTVRGWKAKDKWENLLSGEIIETERPHASEERNATKHDDQEDGEHDELFMDAVLIVIEAKQASVSLLQRRMRIGYTRSARLIDLMERRGIVGPYIGSQPREVLIQEINLLPDELKKHEPPLERKERNAPKKEMERSINTERSDKIKNAPKVEKAPEPEQPEIPDDEGLTPKQRIFVAEYLRDFNATRAAIAAGYSKKTAHTIGWENLRKPEIQSAIRKYNESMMEEIGINAQRVLMEYMKIAFSDITDFIDFGQEELVIKNKKGEVQKDETGSPITVMVNRLSLKESSEVDGTLISEVKEGRDGVSIKLHDKTKALDILTKYIDLLPDKHKRMIEEEKLKLDKERLEFDKVKAAGEGDLDEELIDDWVSGVMGDDETDGEHDQADAGIQEKDTGIS
jgi:phage terminase small subunit